MVHDGKLIKTRDLTDVKCIPFGIELIQLQGAHQFRNLVVLFFVEELEGRVQLSKQVAGVFFYDCSVDLVSFFGQAAVVENNPINSLNNGKKSTSLSEKSTKMEKNPLLRLNEVIAGTSDKKLNRQISALLSKGIIRRITPRLYTPNFDDSADDIIRRNLFEVLGLLYPGALLSHRSAFEFGPTSAGHIFLTHSYTRKVSLPGVIIRFVEGPGPVDRPSNGPNSTYSLRRCPRSTWSCPSPC